MTSKEIEKKNDKDLEKDLKIKRDSLRAFRFGMSGAKTRNTKEGVQLRKDIARILTEVRSREN